MINVAKLKAAIIESGKTQVSLAKEMGMSKNTFNSKVNGRIGFSLDEVVALCEKLNICDSKSKCEIFLSHAS